MGLKLWEIWKSWKNKELYWFEALGDLENVENKELYGFEALGDLENLEKQGTVMV